MGCFFSRVFRVGERDLFLVFCRVNNFCAKRTAYASPHTPWPQYLHAALLEKLSIPNFLTLRQ